MAAIHYRRLRPGVYIEESIGDAVRRLAIPMQTIERWWLINARAGRCDRCANHVFAGQVVAYNHQLGKVLCEPCWETEGLTPQPSKKLRDKQA